MKIFSSAFKKILLLVLVGLLFQVARLGVRAAESKTATASANASPLLVAATEPINLTLTPTSLYLVTDPGVPVKSEIKVRNNNSESEQLFVQIGTFVADAEGEKPKLLDPQPSDTFIPWMRVDQTPFYINPGEWKTIPVEFTPPADAALSYYYTIIIRRTTEQQSEVGRTVFSGAPAVLVLTTVSSPNIRRELQVESFKVESSFLEYLPEKFIITVKNTGNTYVAPTGNIFIDGPGKKDLAVLAINPNINTILPQTSRTFIINWDDGFPVYKPQIGEAGDERDSQGKQLHNLNWDFSKADRLRFGKFTGHLLLVYDNGKRDIPTESFTSFWVFPWKIGLVVLAIVILTLIGIISIGRFLFSIIRKSRDTSLRK